MESKGKVIVATSESKENTYINIAGINVVSTIVDSHRQKSGPAKIV